jgi:hypothetical protein
VHPLKGGKLPHGKASATPSAAPSAPPTTAPAAPPPPPDLPKVDDNANPYR